MGGKEEMSKLPDCSERILRVLVRYFGFCEVKSAFNSTQKKTRAHQGDEDEEEEEEELILSLFSIVGLTPCLSDRWITEHKLVANDEQSESEGEDVSAQ